MHKSGYISVRSKNVCIANNFYDAFDVIDFYKKHGSFISLKNCGLKSNYELTNFCKKFEEITSKCDVQSETSKKYTEIELSHHKIEFLNNIILFNFDKLSARSHNRLKTILDNDY